ncbi:MULTISPECIES: hypothetical protein [unclassified Clostridium]|uniref:hypothetical protein n=1 Tax=unclassified Clostridium TaxID=2614128 RepID=UPI0005FB3B3D|nr:MULTISPECIES: hypothetical protein [unclassified Clostridium]DAL62022.1 MAG TPA_asm: ASCH domain protein [Caudoviricetes sp.]KJZ83890.1 hypothetical protein ClosIBUN125C_CONTIG68g03781 [Clostridium sp. IBUN125C]KJZ87939.1 hypothetical protein ClosIBUN13A_CONTIG46g00494 [Clostridium sp. IBUN13A]KJZ93371.1 hypothetical protein ClosIBUN62F_CONTIG43g01505 [Clostridium sp. IBUN62F]KJZ96419.1 hypothetical protein ClosIBUN22A_CONTIG113g02340 [Clostridium sp. IBUN22A]
MKPILFNTEMVQAILDSRKTTTRRIIKVNNSLEFMGFKEGKALLGKGCCIHETIKAPYMPGDILYVRETWGISNPLGDFARNNRTAEYVYKAGYSKGERIPIDREQEKNLGVWKPSIHMPKVAARIFLKVIGVRVERLQDITEQGIKAEGITEEWPPHAMDKFRKLWDSTTKEYRWETNPWVWVIEFERCDKPNER